MSVPVNSRGVRARAACQPTAPDRFAISSARAMGVWRGAGNEGDPLPGMGRSRCAAARRGREPEPQAAPGTPPGPRRGRQLRRQPDGRRHLSGEAAVPVTPRSEAAGEIVETGSAVDGLRVGQRALAVLRNGGGYAEEIVLDAAAVVPIPDAMDFVRAAAFPVAYGTAHFALTHRAHLQPGETLLVLGAAGGVGLTAVEIGKAMGARVIAAAGGMEKLAVARSRGADELIDYKAESIRDRVRALTGGKG